MAHEIKAGTILIGDDATLPKELVLESRPYITGWRLVADVDANALDRMIRNAGWNFFYRAGEIEATVFGIDGQKMVRRAIERIVAVPRPEKYNSLEIASVDVAGSERFPLVHYVTVSIRLRHIQQSVFLFGAGENPQFDAEERDIGAEGLGCARDSISARSGGKRSAVNTILFA